MKRLDHLQWCQTWMSYVGALKGCANYLGQNTSLPWIYGGTGRAFVINLSSDICPSNPTLWGSPELDKVMALNIGLDIDRVTNGTGTDGFEDSRVMAWETVKRAIDAHLPVFGWEMVMPEFYVVNGYDEVGYYYDGPESGGPKPWQELAEGDIGWLDIGVIHAANTPDDAVAVRTALEFAVSISTKPNPWIHDFGHCGVDAFETWIRALRENTADGFGMAYNSAVWSEARDNAVAFLQEARRRLGVHSVLFDEAIGHYIIVRDMLREISLLFPFREQKPEHIQDEARREQACTCLGSARDAEEAGLAILERLAKAL